jgi:UDP-galactopyranose mutase
MCAARTPAAARVVVVGGGFAGMAAAARLAKLGHRVTLLEADDELGGSLRPLRHAGFAWDRTATTMTLPAVVRDLFRKSGRPLEAELELHPCTPGRRHVFDDGTVLNLPLGSRGRQHEALESVLGAAAARSWTAHLDSLAPVWEVLRRQTLEVPFSGRDAVTAELRRTLRPRRRLAAVARSLGRDPRLRALLLDRYRLAGQDPRALPGFMSVVHHVERGFGRWQPAGGLAALVPVLERRLATRGVDVRLGARALDVDGPLGQVRAVLTASGDAVDADVVVWTAPRWPGLLATTGTAVQPPATPATRTYLGLRGALPELPAETLLHGDPLVLLRTGAAGENGDRAWSVEHHEGGQDVLTTMAHRGIDVRTHVVARVTMSPAQVVSTRGGSPEGILWRSWRSGLQRPVPRTPVDGLYLIGADVHPGPGIVNAGLAAAQVADDVGRAR